MENDCINDVWWETIFLFSIHSLQIKVIKANTILSILQTLAGKKITKLVILPRFFKWWNIEIMPE